ncbi:MAG: metallophosphoesterase, partial [Candidatus Aenigmarchaeota archaeon]|nr:metallophosphoesterase [Candidatus Aenigmarchaeota archaeon]
MICKVLFNSVILCVLFFVLSTPVYADIIITGADAITNFGLSSVEVPTNEVSLEDIFISGEDAVNNLFLSEVEIPTNVVPLTGIFISGEDAINNLDLSYVEIPTEVVPLTDIFISGEDAVTNLFLSKVEILTDVVPLEDIFISGHDAVNSYGLVDLWRGNATISLDSHYNGQTVYTPYIKVNGTAFDETGIVSVVVNGVVSEEKENWSAYVPLKVGMNRVMIVVEDGEGHHTRKLFDVYMVEPFVFVHMTDVHIGYEPTDLSSKAKTNAFVQSIERFADTLQAIKSENPEFILSPGDMVEWSNEDFFNAYNGILECVDIDVYNTPGNHDRRRFIPIDDDGLEKYYAFIVNPNNTIEINSYRDYYFNKQGYRFVGLDSGRDHSSIEYKPWTPEGEGLNKTQINNLTSMNPYIPKIVFIHHPILDKYNDTNDMSSNKNVNNTCSQYGGNDACIADNRCEFINYSINNNVDLVLTGHTHKDYNKTIFNENKTHKTEFIQTRSATKEDYGYRVINITEKGISHKSYSTESELEGNTRYTYWSYVPSHISYSLRIYVTEVKMNGIIPMEYSTGIFSNGNIKREIPDSYFTGDVKTPVIVCYREPNKIVISLYQNKTTIKTSSIKTMDGEQEYFTIGMKHSTESTSVKYIYENITFSDSENATAIVDLNETNVNYTLELDYNGDGNIDNTTKPNHVIINHAPVASIITPTSYQSENITLFYTIEDNQSDNCTILVQYSSDNITWSDATINENLVNITTIPEGRNHSLIWQSKIDLQNVSANVFFRIKPYDAELSGQYATTNAFFVGDEPIIKIIPIT